MPRIPHAIAAVQQIYRDNFFPDMNASWRSYPENIGHKNWPGCTRCHDDEHKTTDGKRKSFSAIALNAILSWPRATASNSRKRRYKARPSSIPEMKFRTASNAATAILAVRSQSVFRVLIRTGSGFP